LAIKTDGNKTEYFLHDFHVFLLCLFAGAAWSLDDDENDSDVLTSTTNQESRNVPLYYTTPPKAVSLQSILIS
jgi:hypothetical protein